MLIDCMHDITGLRRPFKISRFLFSRHPAYPRKMRNFAPCENFPLYGITKPTSCNGAPPKTCECFLLHYIVGNMNHHLNHYPIRISFLIYEQCSTTWVIECSSWYLPSYNVYRTLGNFRGRLITLHASTRGKVTVVLLMFWAQKLSYLEIKGAPLY
jgi:hypothetical protein